MHTDLQQGRGSGLKPLQILNYTSRQEHFTVVAHHSLPTTPSTTHPSTNTANANQRHTLHSHNTTSFDMIPRQHLRINTHRTNKPNDPTRVPSRGLSVPAPRIPNTRLNHDLSFSERKTYLDLQPHLATMTDSPHHRKFSYILTLLPQTANHLHAGKRKENKTHFEWRWS